MEPVLAGPSGDASERAGLLKRDPTVLKARANMVSEKHN